MKTLVNLTPHIVVIRCVDGREITVLPTAPMARVSTEPGRPYRMDEIGVDSIQFMGATTLGAALDLPDPDGDSLFIVSAMVAALVHRDDVFSPGTGPNDGAIRNEKGQVEAVTRLICSAPF